MDLCVLDFSFILILDSDGSRSNECAYRFDFLKYDFYFFYGHANFCLKFIHYIFSTHQHLEIFCTTLHNSSRSPI
jgi:hypothetical protein